MAEIEIMPLDERLSDDDIAELKGALKEVGVRRLPKGNDDAAATLSDSLDENSLTEFMDRLEVHDLACDIYLPVEFDGRIEVANLRIGSAPVLLEVIEEMQDELFTDDDEDEEEYADEEEDEPYLAEGKLRHVWQLFYHGAQAAIDRQLPMHVRP